MAGRRTPRHKPHQTLTATNDVGGDLESLEDDGSLEDGGSLDCDSNASDEAAEDPAGSASYGTAAVAVNRYVVPASAVRSSSRIRGSPSAGSSSNGSELAAGPPPPQLAATLHARGARRSASPSERQVQELAAQGTALAEQLIAKFGVEAARERLHTDGQLLGQQPALCTPLPVKLAPDSWARASGMAGAPVSIEATGGGEVAAAADQASISMELLRQAQVLVPRAPAAVAPCGPLYNTQTSWLWWLLLCRTKSRASWPPSIDRHSPLSTIGLSTLAHPPRRQRRPSALPSCVCGKARRAFAVT